ncbi:MAG TPA: hypothetical protein VJR02_11690 [Pyrinomonadaceae bacterium]|nr:hypothetical protein [Pyrinomonadaceae bacterium]
MILDTWNLGPLGSYLGGSGTTIILGTTVWVIRRLIQERRGTKKPKATVKAEAPIETETPIEVESRVEYFRLLTVLLIVLVAVLGVLLLAVASLVQPSLSGLALSIAAGVITALLVMTALMLGIGAPALRSFWKLKAEVQVLRKEIESLAQNQQLEGNVFPEQQLLPPRKDNVPKTKSRRRQLKPAKADVGD